MIPSNGLPLSSFPPPPRLQPTPTTKTTTSEQPSSNSMTSSSSSSLVFPPNTLLSSIVSSTSSGTPASGSSSLLPDFYAGLLRSPLAAMAASASTTATPLPLLHSSTTPTPSLPPFPLSPPVRQPFQSPPSSNTSPPVSSSPTSTFSSPSKKLLATAAAVNPIQLPPLSSLLTRSASAPVNSVQALLSLPDSSSPASHSTPNLPKRTSSIGGDPPPPPSPLQQRKPSPIREPVTSEASLVEQGWKQIRNWARELGYVADQALLEIQEYGPEPRDQSIRLHSAVGLWLKLEKELADVLGQVPNPLLHGAPSDTRRESLAAVQAPQHQSGSTNNHSVAATATHFPPPLTPTRKSPNRTPPPNDPFPGFALATGPGQAQPSSSDSGLMCEVCLVTESPEWRNGPNGSKTLCNACGLKFAKRRREGGELQTILSLKRRRRKSE